MNCASVILCGGQGRRMKQAYDNKALAQYRGRSLLEHALQKQMNGNVLLSCGPKPFSAEIENALKTIIQQAPLKPTLLYDGSTEHQGPLAGILSALEFCTLKRPDIDALLVSPIDTPRQTPSLNKQLLKEAELGNSEQRSNIILAECAGRTHPLHSLWPLSCLTELKTYLESGERRVMGFIRQWGYRSVNFDNAESFKNINSPEDLL
ncbi:molybdenum cofactor guanylyltransferase [uncultured Pseudoteredinibacter sp.]|uniref:molybdenum cofactor guanylyltransferase n=1 Tax=uncultured Pseudoteredinibacter sp. TaxID=1641701 RepID=UPI00260E4473|nr:molybdenum cofactor guanylyltransferase [uncultured Pseudoteredinibacter sp.]